MFAIKTKSANGLRIVVRGSITLTGAQSLPMVVIANVTQDIKEIVVDMSGCPVLSTAVVNALSQVRESVADMGIAVAIANLSQMNELIYETMGLNAWLPVVELERLESAQET